MRQSTSNNIDGFCSVCRGLCGQGSAWAHDIWAGTDARWMRACVLSDSEGTVDVEAGAHLWPEENLATDT